MSLGCLSKKLEQLLKVKKFQNKIYKEYLILKDLVLKRSKMFLDFYLKLFLN